MARQEVFGRNEAAHARTLNELASVKGGTVTDAPLEQLSVTILRGVSLALARGSLHGDLGLKAAPLASLLLLGRARVVRVCANW